MVLRPRTRLQLRRAVVATALGALFVPAVADAKAKPKTPVIRKVTPKTADVGTKLTITGKNFRRGKAKNSVLFRRDKGKALFVKADVSTTKRLTVVIPKTLEKYMLQKSGAATPTRFRLRVLSSKLSKKYTATKLSPVIGPERSSGTGDGGNSGGAGVPTAPDGDCDSDGVKNAVDIDDDNDLLDDGLEIQLVLDPCVGDTDGDGIEDGYEYKSAIDLNNDDYQSPNHTILYPGKTPYPNALFKDAGIDFDGDGLSLNDEYKLWKYTYQVNGTATRTLWPLSYSDGAQYSLSTLEGGDGRRQPTMAVGAYVPPQTFRNWVVKSSYITPMLFQITHPLDPFPHVRVPIDLYDADRDGTVTTVARRYDDPVTPSGAQLRAEATYWNLDRDNFVSDDERDEDGDGLVNYHEVSGPLTPAFWKGCYPSEGEYPVPYAGTKAYDADSDGDGILDGADDQDFDDIPNIMELSRNMAGDTPIQASCGEAGVYAPPPTIPWKSYVNPFNPCMPDRYSRTCQRHPVIGATYAPFIANFEPYVLN